MQKLTVTGLLREVCWFLARLPSPDNHALPLPIGHVVRS